MEWLSMWLYWCLSYLLLFSIFDPVCFCFCLPLSAFCLFNWALYMFPFFFFPLLVCQLYLFKKDYFLVVTLEFAVHIDNQPKSTSKWHHVASCVVWIPYNKAFLFNSYPCSVLYMLYFSLWILSRFFFVFDFLQLHYDIPRCRFWVIYSVWCSLSFSDLWLESVIFRNSQTLLLQIFLLLLLLSSPIIHMLYLLQLYHSYRVFYSFQCF